MGYTFISYSRKQLYFAESVVLKLQQAGLEIWFDLQKLEPGVNWATKLKDGYTNCEKLLFIASQAAIQSPYVQIEWETALQNGREVIIILAEPMALPESLRSCAIFDARIRFDKIIQELIQYMRGEGIARHDPVPTPRRSAFLTRMPFDVGLTATAMLMPAVTVGIATLSISLTTLPITVGLGLPESFERYYSGYLVGFVACLILALTQYPIRSFLQHNTSYEELSKVRYRLFPPQLVACSLCWLFTVAYPKMPGVNLIGYLIFIFPLVTAYWSFWALKHSPAILRWMPSGQADQDVREKLEGAVVAGVEQQTPLEKGIEQQAAVTYAIHSHPADDHITELVDSILKSRGCTSVNEGEATIQLMIVSNRTSKQWLTERNAALSGQKIHILATNINTPPEMQSLLQTQWIDFRNEREKILQVFAAHLANPNKSNVSYALEISPTGFDNNYGFPRFIRILLGLFVLIFILTFLPIAISFHLPNWVFVPLPAPLVFYMDGLIMRRYSLPAVFHKLLGKRVAWFANSALRAQDAIGNTDRKYITDRSFLLLVDVLKE
jgi:TIR domain